MAESESELCGKCQSKQPYYDASFAPFLYEPPISKLIQAIKFNGKIKYAHLLGELMAKEILARDMPLPELIIPVPLHPARQRKRGFNQVIELSRPIARLTGIALAPDLVVRSQNTLAQSRLKASQRLSNIRGAFALVKKPNNKHIAIMDDVVTTGSTVNELARILKSTGAHTLEVWSLARADYRI
jgi:ComF family protein